jgi:hypothetical protein
MAGNEVGDDNNNDDDDYAKLYKIPFLHPKSCTYSTILSYDFTISLNICYVYVCV